MKDLLVLAYSFLSSVVSTKRLARIAGKKAGRKVNANHTLGFFIGVGTGVSCALLLAPRSGAHTRSLINKKAKQGSDYLKQQAQDLSAAAESLVREGRRESAPVEKGLVDAAHA
jgi:hypothetical protein